MNPEDFILQLIFSNEKCLINESNKVCEKDLIIYSSSQLINQNIFDQNLSLYDIN